MTGIRPRLTEFDPDQGGAGHRFTTFDPDLAQHDRAAADPCDYRPSESNLRNATRLLGRAADRHHGIRAAPQLGNVDGHPVDRSTGVADLAQNRSNFRAEMSLIESSDGQRIVRGLRAPASSTYP